MMTSRPPKEKAIFTNHYAQLTSTLVNIDSLLPHFVTSGIIKDGDQDYIKAGSMNSERVSRLLNYISGPLEAGFTKSYYKMLDIIYDYGNDAARDLAVAMGKKEEISSATPTNLTASDQQQSSSVNSNSDVYTPTEMENFTADIVLQVFDLYYNTMMQCLDHSTVQPMFISGGLVSGSTLDGGPAIFLPDTTVKMPQLLKHVRNSIKLNGPASFIKLVQLLKSNTTYCNLANDMERKCAELKQEHNGDGRSTAAALQSKELKADVTRKQQLQENDEADDDEEVQVEGKKKKKKFKQSMYPIISKRNRPCAIIFNNQTFKPDKLDERTSSENDVDKIITLGNEFGIHFNVYLNQGAQQMKHTLSSAVGAHSNHSALLVFIMTHGLAGDMLYGSDGELVSLKELAAIFEANNCPALKDKPKIFILHCCRGEEEEPAHREGLGGGAGAPRKYNENDTPDMADFLFVHTTTDNHVAYGPMSKGFIPKLVDIFIEHLNEKHLQEVLLIVNLEIAKMKYQCDDGKYYKQMLSVVSQMRDKVWFDKD